VSPTQRSPGRIDSPEQFLALTDEERESRTAALSAIGRAREDGTSVEAAAAQVGTDMRTVRWWASEALQPTGRGGTQPTPEDDLFRVRPIALDGDVGFIGVPGSREAEKAERVFGIQWDFAHGTAGVDALVRLPGSYGGRRVVRDPAELDELARRGLFNIEELYKALVGQ
jgi:hypothetical protein